MKKFDHNRERVLRLIRYLREEDPLDFEAWILLFDDFSDSLTVKERRDMIAFSKEIFDRDFLRLALERYIPELKEEDREIVAAFPASKEGAEALLTMLETQVNCIPGWERLFRELIDFLPEARRVRAKEVLLSTGNFEIISVLGFEEAAKICGLELEVFE